MTAVVGGRPVWFVPRVRVEAESLPAAARRAGAVAERAIRERKMRVTQGSVVTLRITRL